MQSAISDGNEDPNENNETTNNNETFQLLSRRLESLTDRITSSLNISDCANESDVIKKRLDLLEKTINTQDRIRKLFKVMGTYKEILG